MGCLRHNIEETMMTEMNKAIAAGYGKKNFEAVITQMLKS